ncbi:MAG: hypothetical protein LBI27_02235 [Clostridiales bacterium]|jgi:hypothetical protein|nr:hypothetical protein [Clostridiales bacterium]
MSYYPIKCPYCLQELSNYDVFFNLRTGIEGKKREVRDGGTGRSENANSWAGGEEMGSAVDGIPLGEISWFEDEKNSDSGDSWLDGGSGNASAKNESRPANLPTEGLYTFNELKRIFGEHNVKPLYNGDVHAPPALANKPEYKDDLLVGVEILTRKDDMEITTAYRKRFCECGKELMMAAGMKASYIALMLGPSSSGKTMYLISLYNALKEDSGYILPPAETGSKGIAKLYVTVLSGGANEDTSIKKMAYELCEDGKLPFSTFSMGNEPLVLDISVDFKGGKSNNALLFLRDMPGEFLTNPERTEALHGIAEQFPKFDSFIMMLDPFTFSKRNVFSGSESGDKDMDREKLSYIHNLNEVLTGHVVPLIGNKKINQPTAVVITKGDHFFADENKARLHSAGIERALPVLNAYQKVSFDKQYFDETDNGVNLILERLSGNIINLLRKNFGSTFSSVVSALGKEPLPIESRVNEHGIAGDYVITPHAIKPWRVVDPFIRMLMRLNVVPPFDEADIRQPDMDTRDSALARNSKYLAAINAWGRLYCNAWDEISGEALTIPQNNGRGGLFSRR